MDDKTRVEKGYKINIGQSDMCSYDIPAIIDITNGAFERLVLPLDRFTATAMHTFLGVFLEDTQRQKDEENLSALELLEGMQEAGLNPIVVDEEEELERPINYSEFIWICNEFGIDSGLVADDLKNAGKNTQLSHSELKDWLHDNY